MSSLKLQGLSAEAKRVAADSAVPLTVFCLDYCIRYPACSLREIAAKELMTVQSSTDYDSWPKEEQQFKIPQGVTKASVRALDT